MLFEITRNTMVYIVFGWCMHFMCGYILFTCCEWTHWTDLYIRTGLHAAEDSSFTNDESAVGRSIRGGEVNVKQFRLWLLRHVLYCSLNPAPRAIFAYSTPSHAITV